MGEDKPIPEHVAAAMTAVVRWRTGGSPSDRLEPRAFLAALHKAYADHAQGNGITLLHPDALKPDQLAGCLSRGLVLSHDNHHGENTAMVVLRVDGLLEAVSETSPHPLSGDQALMLMRFAMRRSRQVIMPASQVPTLLTEAEAARQATNIARHAAGGMTRRLAIPGTRQLWDEHSVLKLVTGLEYRRMRKAAHGFLRLLDPAALRAMAATSAASIGHYNIYADPRFGRNRRQAAFAFPLLMPAILETPELLRVVDGGERLTEVLAETLGVPVPLVRRLRGVPVRFVPLTERGLTPKLDHLRRLAQALRELPLDHVPSGRRDWISFLALWRASEAHAMNAAFRRPPQPLHRAVRGRWAETADAILAATMGTPPPYRHPQARIAATVQAIRDANDLVSVIYRNFVYPLAICTVAERRNVDMDAGRRMVDGSGGAGELTVIAAEIVYDGLSPAAMVRKSTACHNLPRLFGAFSSATAWHPLLPEGITALNGVKIVTLTTAAALSEEGKIMGHCVAGYASVCAFEGHHILSFRGPDGRPLSTAEMDQVTPKSGLRLIQHRGMANNQPPPTAEAALGWLMRAVASGTIAIDVATIENKRAARLAERRMPVKSLLDGAIVEAFTVWRPHLARPWSRMTLPDFVAEICKRILKTGVMTNPGS